MALYLAQANLSRLRYPPGAPELAEFTEAEDRLNRLADRAPGFVWRLRTGLPTDPRLILNISIWKSYQPLHDYTYRSAHGHLVRRRHEWFDAITQPSTVLWWLPPDARPTPEDALARLTLLRRYGPAPRAFGLRTRFDPAGNRDPGRRRTATGIREPGRW